MTDSDDLRRRAEKRLGEGREIASLSGTVEDPLRLIHELQVHQIELEMQVEELRQARTDESEALEKYTNLYEFAPVGYVTLDRTGTIHNLNRIGCVLIGVERSQLIGRRFGEFVVDEARSAFADFLEKIFTSPSSKTCEVTLRKDGMSELSVQIEGVPSASGEECLVALIDISKRKRAEEELLQATEATEVLRQANVAVEVLRQANIAAMKLSLAKESAEATARTKGLFFANMRGS